MTYLDSFGAWLVDFYVTAGLLLLLATTLMSFVRQPARRLAICWASVVGLLLLAGFTAFPTWPRVSLFVTDVASHSVAVDSIESSSSFGFQDLSLDTDEADFTSTPASEHSQPTGLLEDNSRLVKFGRLAFISTFLSGTVLIAIWLTIGAVCTWRLRVNARRAPRLLQQEFAATFGSQLPTTCVLISEQVNQALAVGVLAPRIILPERFLGQESCEAVAAALSHEAAHLRNGDMKLLALLRMLMLVLFAHPMFWWLRSRIRIDQELLADAAASAQGDVAEYAEILLDWFRINDANRSRALTATLGLWERPHLLKRRIAMLLNRQFRIESHSSTSWRIASWTLITAATLLLSIFTLRTDTKLLADDEPTAASPDATTNSTQRDEDETTEAEEPATATSSEPQNATKGKYSSYQEAWSVGAGFYNAKRYAESRKPFEAALALAADDSARMKVYEVLRPAYRMISNEKKMMEACDFIIGHSDSGPHRSLTRRDLLSFVYQRGKVGDLIERYEADLKADPKDLTALYVLSETYNRYQEDPKRAAELTERLLALELKNNPVDVQTSAQLASQYVRQKKYRDGAELYETIAPLDESLAAWHWKEAANAWLKADDKDRALAAAKKSAASSPEVRSQQLTYYWHRALGDVFLAAGEPKTAVGHFEKAIENTKIDGYLTDSKSLLERAKRLAGDAE